MRLYLGSTALLLAVGFACGCVATFWVLRWAFKRWAANHRPDDKP